MRLQPLGHLSVASSVPLEWAQYTDAADEGKHLMKFFLSNWSELGDSLFEHSEMFEFIPKNAGSIIRFLER